MKLNQLIGFGGALLGFAASVWLLWELMHLPDMMLKAFPAINAEGTGNLLLQTGAIAILSMLIIQSMRELLPIRGWFHEQQLRHWVESGVKRALADPQIQLALEKIEPAGWWQRRTGRALRQPEAARLAMLAWPQSFYNLPIEELCGQIGATGEIALAHPRLYPYVLLALAWSASTIALDAVTVLLYEGDAKLSGQNGETPGPSAVWVDSRSRLAFQIQKNVDAFQVQTANRWRRSIRLAAILVSATFAFAIVRQHNPDLWFGKALLVSIAVGLVAGSLSSLARDLVVALEKLRLK